MEKKCKSCDTTVYIEDYDIDALLIKMVETGYKVVDDDVYQERLAICMKCEHLRYHTTCKICGCFVRIRAKMATKDCPNSEGSLWRREHNVT